MVFGCRGDEEGSYSRGANKWRRLNRATSNIKSKTPIYGRNQGLHREAPPGQPDEARSLHMLVHTYIRACSTAGTHERAVSQSTPFIGDVVVRVFFAKTKRHVCMYMACLQGINVVHTNKPVSHRVVPTGMTCDVNHHGTYCC